MVKRGSKVSRREEYILKHRVFGKYYAGGGLHNARMTVNLGKAIVYTGARLQDMAWDWSMDWKAIKAF